MKLKKFFFIALAALAMISNLMLFNTSELKAYEGTYTERVEINLSKSTNGEGTYTSNVSFDYLKENLVFNVATELSNISYEFRSVSVKYGMIEFQLGSNDYLYLTSSGVYHDWGVGSLNIDANSRIYLYLNVVSRPAITGKDSIINNIDNPYTLVQIREIANLKAIDEYDGDLTSQIQVSKDNYSANKNKLGIYQIEFKVANSVGLETIFALNMINKDLTKPQIEGPSTSTASYTETFDRTAFLNLFSVTDNYDTTITVAIDNDNYKAGIPGSYTINLKAVDSSGNIATKTHTRTLIDDVAPRIIDENTGTIQFNFKDNISDSDLLNGLTASDEIDGDLTSSIVIKQNGIREGILGVYQVVYEVSDSSGNKATLERSFEIINTSAPKFYVSENLISIEDINVMTTDQLVDIIATYEGLQIASYEVFTNEYFGNETTLGSYLFSVKITDTDNQEHTVARKINVFAVSNEDTPKEDNFFTKIFNAIKEFFIKLFNFIKNIFMWLYNFLKNIINTILKIFK